MGPSIPRFCAAAATPGGDRRFGVALALSLLLLLTGMVSQLVIRLAWITSSTGEDYADYAARANDFELPSGLLATNLGIAVLAPISWLLVILVHRMRPRWLSSVQPGIRRRYLGISFAVAALTLVGVRVLSLLIRTVDGWGAQQGFVGFALGLIAGFLVWRTGGLEAAIAAHVVSNVLTYVLAGVTTSVATVGAVEEISWVDAAIDVAGFAVIAVVAVLVARRMSLRSRVLVASTRP